MIDMMQCDDKSNVMHCLKIKAFCQDSFVFSIHICAEEAVTIGEVREEVNGVQFLSGWPLGGWGGLGED